MLELIVLVATHWKIPLSRESELIIVYLWYVACVVRKLGFRLGGDPLLQAPFLGCVLDSQCMCVVCRTCRVGHVVDTVGVVSCVDVCMCAVI